MKKGEYIIVQTKKPMPVLMRNSDFYIFSEEPIELPHQYYYHLDNWEHECKFEINKWGKTEYLAMKSKIDNFHFVVALKPGVCQMFYFTNN